MSDEVAIRVSRLRKAYGTVVAVEDVSFEVARGEIFGMVGPNGAGKTTTIECVEGLRRLDSGHIEVLGLSPLRDRHALLQRIGVQLQESAVPDRLKVWETLDLFGSFYSHAISWRPLLDRLGLSDKSEAPFAKLSGGQKQRLFIALALINNPEVVFLDELTTGLDPHARRAMWDLVREIREQGATVFLTTHNMEEAERLCDRVAVMDHGQIVALDSPERLVRGLEAGKKIVFSVTGTFTPENVSRLPGVTGVDQAGERVTVVGQGEGLIAAVVSALSASGVRYTDLRTEQPTLEDVFLAVTGREMRE